MLSFLLRFEYDKKKTSFTAVQYGYDGSCCILFIA